MLLRLDKLIASQGTYSRSEAQKLIKDGAVKVDGSVIRDRGYRIDTEKSHVTLNGEPFEISEYVYIMLNKPKGVVTATTDKTEKTVVDLVPEEYRKRNLFPAGRLDVTTTGFVLITDDGDFAHRILAPKNHIHKTYEARLAEAITKSMTEAISNGITLKDGTKCMPAEIKVLENNEKPLVEIRICEGKYHQIKRMFAAAGNGVTELKRTCMGRLALDKALKEGECRLLYEKEVNLIEDRT